MKAEDSQGRFLDFHAFRHSFITNIVQAGASAKEAQELARHSTVTLTLDRYSHVSIQATAQALNKLQFLPANEASQAIREGIHSAKHSAEVAERCPDLTKDDEQKTPGTNVTETLASELQVLYSQGFAGDLQDLNRLEEHSNGEDRTPIELFVAGVQGWEANLRRQIGGS